MTIIDREVQIVEQEVSVRGVITVMERHLIEVEIQEPYSGCRFRTGNVMAVVRSHISFCEEGTFTDRGRARAEELLRDLFRAFRAVEGNTAYIQEALRRAEEGRATELQQLGGVDDEPVRTEREQLKDQLERGALTKEACDQAVGPLRDQEAALAAVRTVKARLRDDFLERWWSTDVNAHAVLAVLSAQRAIRDS